MSKFRGRSNNQFLCKDKNCSFGNKMLQVYHKYGDGILIRYCVQKTFTFDDKT